MYLGPIASIYFILLRFSFYLCLIPSHSLSLCPTCLFYLSLPLSFFLSLPLLLYFNRCFRRERILSSLISLTTHTHTRIHISRDGGNWFRTGMSIIQNDTYVCIRVLYSYIRHSHAKYTQCAHVFVLYFINLDDIYFALWYLFVQQRSSLRFSSIFFFVSIRNERNDLDPFSLYICFRWKFISLFASHQCRNRN